jgi:hypothetical protein
MRPAAGGEGLHDFQLSEAHPRAVDYLLQLIPTILLVGEHSGAPLFFAFNLFSCAPLLSRSDSEFLPAEPCPSRASVRPSFPVVGSFPIIELCFSSFSSLLME